MYYNLLRVKAGVGNNFLHLSDMFNNRWTSY